MKREHPPDYGPGGLTTRAKRRNWARKNGQRGGLASGRRRRQLARGRRPARRRTRQEAICLTYQHRQLNREQFAAVYRRVRPTGNLRGLETAWQHYQGLFTRYRCDGQHYRTTNGQRQLALTARGRARCRRQVQRLNRLMAEMGLAAVSHYRDQRDTPGHRDCLVVEIRTPLKNVTPSPKGGEPEPSLRSGGSGSLPQTVEKDPPGNDLSPPAAPADDDGAPSGAEQPVSRRAELEELTQELAHDREAHHG